MNSNDIVFNKVLNKIEKLSNESDKIDYLLYFLQYILKSERTVFLTEDEIPSDGLTKMAWEKKEIICIDNIIENEFYDNVNDNYGDNICSLFFFPVQCQEETIGLLVSAGRSAHLKTEEEIKPLKSGNQTIGVTVKQKEMEIPDYQCSDLNTHYLEERISKLIDMVFCTTPLSQNNVLSSEKESVQKEENNVLRNTFKKVKQLFSLN